MGMGWNVWVMEYILEVLCVLYVCLLCFYYVRFWSVKGGRGDFVDFVVDGLIVMYLVCFFFIYCFDMLYGKGVWMV